MRKISLKTLSILARIGSPFADPAGVSKSISDGKVNYNFSDVAKFVFIHSADPAEVDRVAYRDFADFTKVADDFCEKIKPKDLQKIIEEIALDTEQISRNEVEVIPDENARSSKNSPSPMP